MDNLKQVIEKIGRDVGEFLNNSITASQARALIDDKLKNNGDPFVTRSKLPTIDTSQLASKNDLEELKRSVGSGGASGELKGQGFPYALNADIGTIYTDTTAKNGAVKWIKKPLELDLTLGLYCLAMSNISQEFHRAKTTLT